MTLETCIFCKILAGKLPATVVAETDELLVIKDINPQALIHYLIFPKKHIQDLQHFIVDDMHLGQKMFAMAHELWKQEQQDFKLVINSGKKVGQLVPHLHMHYLAGGKLGHL